MLDQWDKLHQSLKLDEVKKYHEDLQKRKGSLVMKRAFDLFFSILLLLLLLPLMIIISIAIKVDSSGPALFSQTRVTKNNRDFKILKFRSMIADADQLGTEVTVSNDPRVTRVGKILRKYRLDEFPQLINIIRGEMSFVGTRPEVRKYVDVYSKEMMATLLLPAGVTSLTSILYKNEQDLLDKSKDVDQTYVEEILPRKMKYNLEYLTNFSFLGDLKIILMTVKEVIF